MTEDQEVEVAKVEHLFQIYFDEGLYQIVLTCTGCPDAKDHLFSSSRNYLSGYNDATNEWEHV